MIEIQGEIYLLAAEAARHLKVSRPTFYKRYLPKLKPCAIGELSRDHYKVSDLEQMNVARYKDKAS